jgi:ubiquinone/menaquinone biosynthesis C-methylase UbiE
MAETVKALAAHILPHVKPNMKVLDVGCGTGTLACDFAKLVPQGSVLGLDKNEDDLAAAREQAASKGVTNVSFVPGDACSLDFPDGEFDIVYEHQVFHHVNATTALKEMKRVTKPGGIVACRDVTRILHWPTIAEAEEFMHLSDKVVEGYGGNSNTGSQYRKFSREAGFREDEVSIGAVASCCATKSSVQFFWGE